MIEIHLPGLTGSVTRDTIKAVDLHNKEVYAILFLVLGQDCPLLHDQDHLCLRESHVPTASIPAQVKSCHGPTIKSDLQRFMFYVISYGWHGKRTMEELLYF